MTTTQTHVPLTRVWAIAGAVFVGTALASRALMRLASPMPSYWMGLVGLIAIAVALVMSWRWIGRPGAHTRTARNMLRGVVVIGAVMWLLAMLFPFL